MKPYDTEELVGILMDTLTDKLSECLGDAFFLSEESEDILYTVLDRVLKETLEGSNADL